MPMEQQPDESAPQQPEEEEAEDQVDAGMDGEIPDGGDTGADAE